MRHSPSDHVKNQLKSIMKCRDQPGIMGQACNLNIRAVEAGGLRVQDHGWLSQKNNTVGKRRVSHSPPKEIFKMDDRCIKVIEVVSHQGHAEQSLDVIQCHTHHREHRKRTDDNDILAGFRENLESSLAVSQKAEQFPYG